MCVDLCFVPVFIIDSVYILVEKMSSVEELQQMKKQVDCLMKVLTDCSRVVKKYTDLNS